jgi:general nucleoside transport system permease protein
MSLQQVLGFVVDLLAATVAAGTVLLLASLGEIISEKGGILNLGVEGMILIGAIAGFMAAQATGSLLVAVIVAMLAGGLLALIHAFLTVTLRANQVVSGLALTIFGAGVSSLLGQPYPSTQAAVVQFQSIAIPGLSDIPYIGQIFFRQNLLVYISILLVPVVWIILNKTHLGLKIRSAGEDPAATDAAGINVFAVRYGCTIAGGILAGLAGVFMTLGYMSFWKDGISAGSGWIAIGLVIFASWNPWKALLGSYLFGLIGGLGIKLQTLHMYGIYIPGEQLFPMLPYILTVVVLIFATGRLRGRKLGAPAALSVAYDREAR